MQHVPSGGGGGWMWGQIQSTLSLKVSISSCISRKAKAESRGNRLLHFWNALPDKLIYTLRQGWAAICHRGLRVCRFHSNRRLRWRIALTSSFSVADSVLISDISCYTGFDYNANLDTLHLSIVCKGPFLHQSHSEVLTCLDCFFLYVCISTSCTTVALASKHLCGY